MGIIDLIAIATFTGNNERLKKRETGKSKKRKSAEYNEIQEGDVYENVYKGMRCGKEEVG